MAALLVLLVFAMARGGVADPDIWWHLRNAQYLLTNLRLPRVDMYSFTVIGHPWINHEWLAEIPYYLGWKAFGLIGIEAVWLLVLELIFLGVLYLCWRTSGNIKAAAIASYFAVFLATVSFGPRTILFGYAYLVALLVVMERFRRLGKGPLWIIPPLFCLWINTHGSWSLGIIVFGIIIITGMVGGRWGNIEAARWSPPQLRKLWTTMAASVAALFVNPYGYRLVLYPFDLAFHQKLNVAHVAEWVSVDFHNPRGKVALILIVALLLGALLSGYRWKLHELGLMLFALYSGLTYIRFLFLAAILIAPLLAHFLDFIPPYRPEIDKPVLNAVIMVAVLAIILRTFPSQAQLNQQVEKEYPAEILPYLQVQPHPDRVLNFYLWGGYLGWKDRDFKDFVDSRVDIFEYAGVFKDYLDLLGLKDPPAILDKYGIRYVLWPSNEPLSYVLKHDPNWKVVFSGRICVMFQRVSGAPALHSAAPAGAAKAG